MKGLTPSIYPDIPHAFSKKYKSSPIVNGVILSKSTMILGTPPSTCARTVASNADLFI